MLKRMCFLDKVCAVLLNTLIVTPTFWLSDNSQKCVPSNIPVNLLTFVADWCVIVCLTPAGTRAVAFVSGGFLPEAVRGGVFTGYISVADWYGTLSKMVGVSPDDNVDGVPPVDSIDVWSSLMVPNGTSTPRTEIFMS